MKLLKITSRYYTVALVIMCLIGGVFSYIIISQIINDEFNDKLRAEKDQFLFEWHNYEELKETLYLNVGDRIEIKKLERDPQLSELMHDTLMYDNYERKVLPFRQLIFSENLNREFYLVTITKSLVPTEDLIKGVGKIILFLIVSLFIVVTIINRKLSMSLWKPFNDTLTKVESFNFSDKKLPQFSETSIDEFERLNKTLTKMIAKGKKDYFNLQEFTENASHEIQTPLAIIKSKAELLLQGSNLNDEGLSDVSKIYEAANRLSKLKTSLALLTKLDNSQFEEVEVIDLNKFINKKIGHFEELIELKNISLTTNIEGHPKVVMNYSLAYILITNLLSNAIKHNVDGGFIDVLLGQHELIIKNTGNTTSENPENYFHRFKKGSKSADSSGLGLSLVKKICDIYEMNINYTIVDSIHSIVIRFS